ncbi:MAG: type II secretion system protein GspK [Pseudomonadota bacterium]|nr:type II secretion system protein GspK [Pseudomonadota bacterium]
MKRQSSHGRRGSILIIVLWILLLISLLAGRYLSHNRGKAAAAAYGWKSLVREQAVQSVLELYATSGQPLPEDVNMEEAQPAEDDANNEPDGDTGLQSWRELTIGGFHLLVRDSSEGKRVNLNSAADTAIRKQIRQGLGEDFREEADQVTDALLDWRDTDDLVRSAGAEADFYQQEGLSYEPADGPFKALSEMLLVRGVTPELFWGTAPEITPADSMELENPPFSLINAFTINGKNVKRVEILFPRDDGSAAAYTAFLQQKNRKWELIRCYRCYLMKKDKGYTGSEDRRQKAEG